MCNYVMAIAGLTLFPEVPDDEREQHPLWAEKPKRFWIYTVNWNSLTELWIANPNGCNISASSVTIGGAHLGTGSFVFGDGLKTHLHIHWLHNWECFFFFFSPAIKNKNTCEFDWDFIPWQWLHFDQIFYLKKKIIVHFGNWNRNVLALTSPSNGLDVWF